MRCDTRPDAMRSFLEFFETEQAAILRCLIVGKYTSNGWCSPFWTCLLKAFGRVGRVGQARQGRLSSFIGRTAFSAFSSGNGCSGSAFSGRAGLEMDLHLWPHLTIECMVFCSVEIMCVRTLYVRVRQSCLEPCG